MKLPVIHIICPLLIDEALPSAEADMLPPSIPTHLRPLAAFPLLVQRPVSRCASERGAHVRARGRVPRLVRRCSSKLTCIPYHFAAARYSFLDLRLSCMLGLGHPGCSCNNLLPVIANKENIYSRCTCSRKQRARQRLRRCKFACPFTVLLSTHIPLPELETHICYTTDVRGPYGTAIPLPQSRSYQLIPNPKPSSSLLLLLLRCRNPVVKRQARRAKGPANEFQTTSYVACK